MPPKSALVGCVAKEFKVSVTETSALSTPGGIVALFPPGNVIVPPPDAFIGCVTVAIVPEIRMDTELDFVASMELVAPTLTI
jgi:hypothetical protein